jgi:ABC-type multidrug transport system fused ATPase/permease subunit
MNNNKSFLNNFFELIKPFKKPLLLEIIFLFIVQIIGAFSPYLFGKGVDAVTSNNVSLTILFLTIAFVLSFIQSIVINWFREIVEIKKLDWHIAKHLSKKAIEKMFSFSIGQHINENSGVKQTIVNKGQNSLFNALMNTLYNMLPILVQIIVTIIILTIFDLMLGLSAFVFVFVYIYISYLRNVKFFPIADDLRKKNQTQLKNQSELFRNANLVISEAKEENTTNEFDNNFFELNKLQTNVWSKYLSKYYLHKMLILVGQYTTLTVGIFLILNGKHSTGMFVTLYAWIISIFGNLTTLMNSQRRILMEIVEIKKYFDLLNISPDVDLNLNGKTIEDLQGSIEFKNVSFAYPYRKSLKEIENEENNFTNQDNTVSNINLKIQAGSKVGFVGVSGAGKSTIVNLIRRFYDPTEGEIFIDNVPLRDLNLRWFRSKIGNVEQKIDLFDRSVKDNILFGLEGELKDPEKLNKAIKDASLEEFVLKLKDHGLDTVIGEGGIKISGGERQRIGIARALIKDPKILIFDEATSSLDSINEKMIHDAINKSSEGRTTIIIAHRLSTVMDADMIFVVSEGKIVDFGTHKELEQKSEEYKKLIKNQILIS